MAIDTIGSVSMQASGGAANPMLPAARTTTGVQFLDPGRVAPAIAGAPAPPAFSGDNRGDSDGGGGGGSGGEAEQNDGKIRTPERGENAERAPAAAEAPLRRARVSVRARSEAPMVRKNADTEIQIYAVCCQQIARIHMSGYIQKNEIHAYIFVLVCFSSFFFNESWLHMHACVYRSAMDANGGSMGRRWPRVTRVPGLTTAAPWPQDAPSENRYKYGTNKKLYIIYICMSRLVLYVVNI